MVAAPPSEVRPPAQEQAQRQVLILWLDVGVVLLGGAPPWARPCPGFSCPELPSETSRELLPPHCSEVGSSLLPTPGTGHWAFSPDGGMAIPPPPPTAPRKPGLATSQDKKMFWGEGVRAG